MAQRHQRGWLKKEMRTEGETWVLFFRTTRKSNGKRVENKVRIGLVKEFPDESSARAEVDRLHPQLNPVDLQGKVTLSTWHTTMPSMNWWSTQNLYTRRPTQL